MSRLDGPTGMHLYELRQHLIVMRLRNSSGVETGMVDPNVGSANNEEIQRSLVCLDRIFELLGAGRTENE